MEPIQRQDLFREALFRKLAVLLRYWLRFSVSLFSQLQFWNF